MAKFDVSNEVDELSYDFEKFVPGAKGVIPEPTSDMIGEFRRAITTSIPVKEDGEGKRGIDFDALKEKVQDDKGAGLEAELYGAVAALCSNTPSADEIKALPFRAQRAFIGWIVGMFLRPETSAPATKA